MIEAENAGGALLFCGSFTHPIHLLLTDVVMPRVSGRELADRFLRHLELAVLCVSGYADDAIVHHGVVDNAIALLPKPITAEPLLRKVRQVLEQRAITTHRPTSELD